MFLVNQFLILVDHLHKPSQLLVHIDKISQPDHGGQLLTFEYSLNAGLQSSTENILPPRQNLPTSARWCAAYFREMIPWNHSANFPADESYTLWVWVSLNHSWAACFVPSLPNLFRLDETGLKSSSITSGSELSSNSIYENQSISQ